VPDLAQLRVGSRFPRAQRPEHTIRHRPNLEEHTLKKDLHPKYVATTVTCTCGNTFETRSTVTGGKIASDVCSQCHPFYTGKQKILDTGGRIARFQARYGKKVEKVEKVDKAEKVDK
jgi:large subunit ribosomal protein L31